MSKQKRTFEPWVDYGCPDWRDISAYGNTDGWVDERWHWEFLRRRHDYRQWFHRMALMVRSERYSPPLPPGTPMWMEEYADLVVSAKPAQAAKFGFGACPNPIYSDRPQEFWELHEDVRLPLKARTLTPCHLAWLQRGKTSELPPTMHVHLSDLLQANEVVGVTFDLRRPIAPQLEGIQAYLESIKTDAAPPEALRQHKEKWLRYLRILDAREAGASWSECMEILPKHVRRSPQSARDTHKQAAQLQSRL